MSDDCRIAHIACTQKIRTTEDHDLLRPVCLPDGSTDAAFYEEAIKLMAKINGCYRKDLTSVTRSPTPPAAKAPPAPFSCNGKGEITRYVSRMSYRIVSAGAGLDRIDFDLGGTVTIPCKPGEKSEETAQRLVARARQETRTLQAVRFITGETPDETKLLAASLNHRRRGTK